MSFRFGPMRGRSRRETVLYFVSVDSSSISNLVTKGSKLTAFEAIFRLEEFCCFVLLLLSATMPSVSFMTIEIDQSSGVARVTLFFLSLVFVFSYECQVYDSLEFCDLGMVSFLSCVHVQFTA